MKFKNEKTVLTTLAIALVAVLLSIFILKITNTRMFEGFKEKMEKKLEENLENKLQKKLKNPFENI
jgi:ABC-type bacteriocin/lantibiotic exporter with double-glycine peptidase domain